MNLKRKVGPLPLYGWALLAGGGLGLVLLVKASKRKAAAPGEPEASALVGPPSGVGVGSEGGGGGGGEVKTPMEPAQAQPVTSPVYERGGFAGEVADVQEGRSALEALGLYPPSTGATSSTAGAAHASRVKAHGGNPRAGIPFKAATYHGHAAHEYAHAVPGGVGPGHRFVVLPIGKKGHAKKHNHAPAHAKDHHPVHHPPKPKPRPRPAAAKRRRAHHKPVKHHRAGAR